MDTFKFFIFSIIALGLLGVLGYWSFTTLQSGPEYVKDQKVRELEKENKDLAKQIQTQKNQIASLESKLPKEQPTTPAPTKELESIVIYKYQDLINELQKLSSSKVYLKEKSKGPAVGTVQKFLNIYNKTSNKVDNDYGASTKVAVAAFQKDQKLSSDGEAGPGTFNKMIEWLKKQG